MMMRRNPHDDGVGAAMGGVEANVGGVEANSVVLRQTCLVLRQISVMLRQVSIASRHSEGVQVAWRWCRNQNDDGVGAAMGVV